MYQKDTNEAATAAIEQMIKDMDWGDIIKAIENKGYTVKIRKQDAAIIRTKEREQR